jgi:hypothetical protein
MKLLVIVFPLLLALASCTEEPPAPQPAQPVFDSIPVAKQLTPPIDEISGIAASHKIPQHLWGHEDSGNPPQLYLIKEDGTVQKKVFIKDAVNRDWEDMTAAGGDLYIGDIGDNNRAFSDYTIYKIPEPDATEDTVVAIEKIWFQYPDGAHDAEALLVDAGTKDIYIITKRDNPSLIYKIAFPYSFTELNTAVKVGQLNYSGVVSAALSPDANEIIVKTYMSLFHYNCKGKPIEAALQTGPALLPYIMEPQGEAVTFAAGNSGYYTLSEKGLPNAVNLYFYKRR